MSTAKYCFRFLTGSQFLYGPETLAQVDVNSRTIVRALEESGRLPFPLEYAGTVKSGEEAAAQMMAANADPQCAGIVCFMHTFSPSKMWIQALGLLQKPYLHFHTQFNEEIPNDAIDMDYMNLYQSAHGDREHGFIGTRMRIPRKIIAGHWSESCVQERIGKWMRAAIAVMHSRSLKVMRFGDNMREVAVTEGDKVGVQIQLGWQVNTWSVGLLAQTIDAVREEEADALIEEYRSLYIFDTQDIDAVRYQAKAQLAMQKLLEQEGCHAFCNTFEDLYGMRQLPGLASQDLMRRGYGYGGEGDWKVAALTRIVKEMTYGMRGGTSFMEDYTYDMRGGLTLGAHMLEVCPTLAAEKPRVQVHALGIGGKQPPARLVFAGKAGAAVAASLVDMGGRLRLIVQDVVCVTPTQTMPNLPVARVMWRPQPDLTTAAEAWILAGGAHHTVLSYDCDASMLRDYARMMEIEFVHIHKHTDLYQLEQELRLADFMWKLKV